MAWVIQKKGAKLDAEAVRGFAREVFRTIRSRNTSNLRGISDDGIRKSPKVQTA